MGYTTSFSGGLKLNRELTHKEWLELKELASYEKDVYLRYTDSPETIPDSYNQWESNEAGDEIAWNAGEKFYDYIHWLRWIIKHYLKPRDLVLNGEIRWQGEEIGDIGVIRAEENKITTRKLELEGIVECPHCGGKFVPKDVA